jgi:SHS2 domain-containing protein
MPYAYTDDIAIADLAFRAWGPTLEATFMAAADATTNAMVDNVDALTLQEQRTFTLYDDSLELLLLQFLQELLYYKDAQRLLLRVQEVAIQEADGRFVLQARAAGEPIDPARHELGADVKGVTLHRLHVAQTPTGWEAVVVLDV